MDHGLLVTCFIVSWFVIANMLARESDGVYLGHLLTLVFSGVSAVISSVVLWALVVVVMEFPLLTSAFALLVGVLWCSVVWTHKHYSRKQIV